MHCICMLYVYVYTVVVGVYIYTYVYVICVFTEYIYFCIGLGGMLIISINQIDVNISNVLHQEKNSAC